VEIILPKKNKHWMTGMRYSGMVITLVMAGFILLAGCTGYGTGKTSDSTNTLQTGLRVLAPEGNDPSSLVGPWYAKVLIINGAPNVPVRLTGIQLTIHNNGSFSGFDSCNPYTGLWQADKKHIMISRILSPMTYCNEPPGVMEQESEYFALLENSSFYGVNGEDMILSDKTGENGLIFKRVYF
jgi:heat shock protein HslJ